MGAADDPEKETFFRVGSALVKEGVLRNMTAADVKIFMVLSLHANWRTGRCWPSYKTIRDLTGCSRSSIAGALRHLVQLGAISFKREKAHNGCRNVYHVFRTLSPAPRSQSSATDYPPSTAKRDKSGRFQSSATDEGQSSFADDPQSSRADQNEIYLNENHRTRSKDNAPPPLPGSGQAPEASARPSLIISEETIREILKAKSKEAVIAMLKQGNHPVPPFLLIDENPGEND